MSEIRRHVTKLPPEQEAIRAKCFHPTGKFIEFKKEEIEQSIPDRFEQQAVKYPDRLAVKTRNHQLSYDALNKAANRVARAILAQRGGGEEPIALLLEHDAPMIVAFLGVLKAGKICVPLDPSFPRVRIAYMLEDSQAGLVVSNRKNLSLARELAQDGCRLMNIDELDSGLPIENAGLSISPDNLTYVVYTSGSTGRPKGVIQNHRSGLYDAMIYTDGLHISADDRLALLYSCSTGGGIKIMFSALLNGAALCPFDLKEEGVGNLANWLIREGITIYFSIPIVFRQFVSTFTGQEKFPKLRLIQLGSDSVTLGEVEQYKKHFSANSIFVIRLGTTETGTCRRYFIDRESPLVGNMVPVGYAIEDMEVSLLDEEGKKVGFNRIGEIAVKSRYLSPGYWRRPDLTQAKFLPDPNGGEERIYLTGDLGRMLPDGCLYHLGRKDFQVKVRGYRIEVAEIEAVLLSLDTVKEAVVVAGEDRPDDPSAPLRTGKQLVAYIVPVNKPPPTVTTLRRALAERLTDYMIPSTFVMLDTLPLTPSGKVDRHALPAPDWGRPEVDEAFVTPRTPTEEVLAGMWAEVLCLKQVGVLDNFFDLGGNSLLVTQVISRIRDAFQVELPFRRFFEAPTVTELASAILQDSGEQKVLLHEEGVDSSPSRRISRGKESDPVPLSFAQQRLWFLDQLEPGSIVYNLSRSIRITGPLNVAAFEQSLNEIVRRHESLRTTFVSVDGEPIQVIDLARPFSLPIVNLEHIPEREREAEARRLATEETHQPFDLAKGPLIRTTLLRLGEEDHVFQRTMHHIVSDGWSTAVFERELWTLYQAFSKGQSSPLPELEIQYADFAAWQRQWLQGEVLEKQLSYWKQQLSDLPTLTLPASRPRPAVQSFRGARQSLALSKTLSDGLKALSRNNGVTLFMTLLAAFKTLVHRYTGQNDIIVGTDIANRNRLETEGLIGFFVNLLVIRTDLSENPTFRELLKRVREVTLGAYAHQDLPFEKLVEELKPERDLSRNPLVQVLFVLQSLPLQTPAVSGLTLHPFELSSETSRFDLALFMAEKEGQLIATCSYSTDLFDPAAIGRMLNCFQNLLGDIVDKPEKGIENLLLWSGAEKEKLIGGFNQDLD